MRRTTGAEPVVWGTMIGFGRHPYTTADGKHHEYFAIGLAARRAALTLHGLTYYGTQIARSQPPPRALSLPGAKIVEG